MSLVALEILLQQVSRIALQIGITVRITGRLSVHSIVHAIEAQVHLSLTGIQSNQGIGRSMGIYSCRNTAVISLFPVLLQYDIEEEPETDRKSTRLNSSHQIISYAVFCLKKKNYTEQVFYVSRFAKSLFGASIIVWVIVSMASNSSVTRFLCVMQQSSVRLGGTIVGVCGR